jgi:hypothetical protein
MLFVTEFKLLPSKELQPLSTVISQLLDDDQKNDSQDAKPEKRLPKFNLAFLIPKRAIPKISFSKRSRSNSQLSTDNADAPMIIPVGDESISDDSVSPRTDSPRTEGFTPRSEERKLESCLVRQGSEYKRIQRKRLQSFFNANEEHELAMAGTLTKKHRYKVSALEYKAFANLLLMANE